jgi:molybdopterin synthase sulfur carrier subunit
VAKAYVKLPVGMTTAGGERKIACEATTVAQALDLAIAAEPRLKPRVFREDGRMWAGVFLNARNINALGGLDTPLKDDDVLSVIPPISGG